MQLVILAAGHGRRFGGLKQLAPVGPAGEAIMDYTVAASLAAGIRRIVVVVREEIRDEITDHLRRAWPPEVEVAVVCQPPVPGTAQAVLAARPAVDGPFAVANADDLYGEEAFRSVAAHFAPVASPSRSHVLVAFHLERTVLTDAPVTRGLCEVADNGRLVAIVEHTVTLREDGRFSARPLPSNLASEMNSAARVLSGDEATSMNLWGFEERMMDHLAEALARFDQRGAARTELLLPDVVNQVVSSGADEVTVTSTSSRCIGITHPDDLPMVRDELAFALSRLGTEASGTAPGR